jgi:hypothetical protein
MIPSLLCWFEVKSTLLEWTKDGDYGPGGVFKQKLVVYGDKMPPPDGADQVRIFSPGDSVWYTLMDSLKVGEW